MDNSQITDDQMFYRNLLVKYMRLIDDEEGVFFFEHPSVSTILFTDAELIELDRIKSLIIHS